MNLGATVPMHTSVVTVCSITGAFNKRMFSDFSGNGGTVFSENLGDLSKRFSVEKTVFHFHSFFVCDIIRHGINLLLTWVDTLQHIRGILLCGETISFAAVSIISQNEVAENF